ncbi:serine acetyltransferase [Streptococcus infantarius subsp. infantarius]|uniref:serine O-acetyltransferase n=1 Tax=Streptococcus parasuis TaxID=1501662 RepID=UPI00208E0417|nr:serine acetyltransferase [Streptococcus infantarius subsp. infantarius]
MITSKKEYLFYLEQDKKALGIKKRFPSLIGDEVWKFQRRLRRTEFLKNTSGSNLIKKFFYALSMIKFHKLRVKYGFSIPLNVFGPGLSIAHRGTIVVNGNAKIGKNCRIQECTTIGATNGSSCAPILGDNIFIGSGARIIGDIRIADNIAIGANALVCKDCLESGITIAGVPAKKISDKDSHQNLLLKVE